MNFNSKEVSDFFLQLFLETMNYREKCDVKRNDLIDLLIQLKTKDSIGDVDWQNEQDQSENGMSCFRLQFHDETCCSDRNMLIVMCYSWIVTCCATLENEK